MKICAAQVRPFKGDINRNIEHHKSFITVAAAHGADFIVFPELSLTGYEPTVARALSMHQNDSRLDIFQALSDTNPITIGIGLPTTGSNGIHISMVIFQPNEKRLTYSKQHLHDDELPYFTSGQHQVMVSAGNTKIAPAICYESLVPEHAEQASGLGATIYATSVAKSAGGVEKAFRHYPVIAAHYSMTVLMANCIGPSDTFESAGMSAVWNSRGELLVHLDSVTEGILILDTDTEEVFIKKQ